MTRSLDDRRKAELALVQRAVAHEPTAIRELFALMERAAADAARALKQPPHFRDEVASALSARLLLPRAEAPPRLVTFAGRSSLETWLKSAALRVGLNLLDGQRKDHESLRDSHHDPQPSVEKQLLRHRHAPAFGVALENALRHLPKDERALMKLVFVEGLSLDQIGKLHSVHKSTISRQVARIRAALLETVFAELSTAFGLRRSELESLAALLNSQIEFSLTHGLAEGSDDEL